MNEYIKIQSTDSTESNEYECPLCNGTGWKRIWDEENEVYIGEKCDCGTYEKKILQNQLQFAEIPDMYKECNFGNLKSSVYQFPESKGIFIQAAKTVKYWIKNIVQMQKEGMGLYIYSKEKGSGKTRFACSMANELMEKHQKAVKFTTSLRILDEIKDSWGTRKDVSENKLIENLVRADILIIDDFGTESSKEWINNRFYEIINGRYVDKKITIFTSNYPIKDLRYDERITDRIIERSLEVHFPEESVRRNIAETIKQRILKEIQGINDEQEAMEKSNEQ